MTVQDLIVAAYRGLQRLYPRAFRDEFGDDMTALFRDQLRDEPTWRVCGRGIVDLASTIPVQHVEVHMNRTRTPLLVLLGSFVAAAAGFAFVDGLLGLVVAALGAALAVLTWRHERPAPLQRDAAQGWWKLLGGGGALLAVVIGVSSAIGELSDATWAVTAIAFLVSITLLGAGVVLGLVHLADRRRSTEVPA